MQQTIIASLLAPAVPVVLIYLAGVVVAAVRFSAHPRVSALSITGFGLLLVGRVIAAGTSIMSLPQFRGDVSYQQLAVKLGLLNLATIALTCIGMVFVVLAVFSDRGSEQQLASASGQSWPHS